MTTRVLIVKTTSMGDILHTLPALTDAVKQNLGIKFDWVVEEGFAQIPSWHCAVDKVIPVALRRWRKKWFSKQNRLERQEFIRQLQSQQYDYVIDAQGLLKSALITRKALGEKHGYDRKSIKEPLASYFYDVKHRISKELHAVERIRLLFSQSLSYWLDEQMGDYGIASHFKQTSSDEESDYLIFLHATTRKEKHWTEKEWHRLISKVGEQGYRVKLPWGSLPEKQRAERLSEGHSNVIVLPKLTLAEVAAELAHAKAVVSVDTGLSHLAAALDKPNFTLFGPTDPQLIGGYGLNQNQIISNNQKMSSIKADTLFEQLKKYL